MQMTSTTEERIDYLDEDEPIRNQNYVCVSFINPEDVIVNKDAFYFSKFLNKFSDDMNEMFTNLATKFSSEKEIIDGIKDANKHIFSPTEMSDQFNFFKNTNSETLEKEYHEQNEFKTSIRGIKIRGTYDNIEQAKKRCEQLKKKDPYFHIYVAQVGCWLPYESHVTSSIEEQEFSEEQLNTLMKHYKENKDSKDALFDERKMNAMNLNQVTSAEVISDELTEANDPWMDKDKKYVE